MARAMAMRARRSAGGFGRRLRALRRWLRPRSAGVKVTRATLRRIDRGDAARDDGRWSDAAAGYEAALALDPGLAHIWVQLGHARREAGATASARDAYAEASRCAPRDRETRLVLADLARKAGDREALLTHTLAAFRLDPGDRATRAALLRSLSAAQPGHAPLIAEVAATLPAGATGRADAAPLAPALWVDVGDLVDHLMRARLPSGLQRLQMEAGRAMTARPADEVALCCYIPVDAAWKALPGDRFRALVDAASETDAIGDEAWHALLAGVLAELALAPPIAFAPGATLFNLGFAWGDEAYHPAIAALKRERGVRFAALACDVIPLVRPGEIPADIVAACGRWLDDLAAVADRVVAVSSATRDEIVRVSRSRGSPIAAEAIAVVPHDSGFSPPAETLPIAALGRWRLRAGGFVLYPSTVEPRKNHLGALAAWRRLVEVLGEEGVPDLVFVGRMGWRSGGVVRAIDDHLSLARRVRLLSGISDAELDLLYRGCAFLLYPSLHEGWGMPVTEALCYGKVPAIGRNSSLPEAGGRFAVYYDAADPASIAQAVTPLIVDPAFRAGREALIRAEFRPRSWETIAADFAAAARG